MADEVPDGATLEADLNGVAVWDVSALLPTHGEKTYPTRHASEVSHLFVHHSGRLGRRGFEGLLNSTRYVTRHRGFPGCAYHLWLPFEECRDSDGRLIVFRANAPETRSWHTGGAMNGIGESLALQGNTTANGLSNWQREALEAALPYRYAAIDLASDSTPTLSWHSEAHRWGGKSKPTCPGTAAVQWLTNYRHSADWTGRLSSVVESSS